ncbi:hypothetical protein FH5T_08190 [Draconibacterium orientale]|uniref:KTSC domain-containing protein n=2 Tax=Draconibacterium orientale TaxID=1168034 RepID=A0ABM5QDP5_9BACT|nr:hypothetical protein FH5T_08190 [Draconibacterium orientale]
MTKRPLSNFRHIPDAVRRSQRIVYPIQLGTSKEKTKRGGIGKFAFLVIAIKIISMKKLFLFSCLLFFITAIQAQTCKDLPTHFNSYNEAVSKVEKTTFKVKDKITCYGSSWISKATYHSCDGDTGYFILYAQNGNSYIHKGVPLSVWEKFKSADSFGSYYSKYIKGKYQLKI